MSIYCIYTWVGTQYIAPHYSPPLIYDSVLYNNNSKLPDLTSFITVIQVCLMSTLRLWGGGGGDAEGGRPTTSILYSVDTVQGLIPANKSQSKMNRKMYSDSAVSNSNSSREKLKVLISTYRP